MMKGYTLGSTWWLVTALAVSVNLTALAQDDDSKPVPGTRQASCLVRITYDPAVLPLTEAMVEALVRSTTISDEPARELLGSNIQVEDYSVTFDVPRARGSRPEPMQPRAASGPGRANERVLIGRIRVSIYSEDVPPAAAELLAEVCRRLERALRDAGASDERRFRVRLESVEQELNEAEARLEAIRLEQQRLMAAAGRDDLSRERITDMLRDHEDEKHELELEVAGDKAREAALTEQIGKIGREVQETVGKSSVAAELAKIVELREKEVARIQQLEEKELAPPHELDAVLEELARARAELAKYRETASETAGGGLLGELNKELVTLTTRTAEREARLRLIESRLEDIRSRALLKLAQHFERLTTHVSLVEQSLRELMVEREQLSREIRDLRPAELVVIGAM